MRLTHPRDIAAIKEWVNVHADPEQAQEMIASLAALPIGTAWFWSPGWLDVFRKVKIRRRETFDSSATPKVGDAPRRPRTLAEVEVQALGAQIAATVQRAKESDPRELKQRIAELERQLAQAKPEKVVERIEVPVLANGQVQAMRDTIATLQSVGQQVVAVGQDLQATLTRWKQPGPAPCTEPRPTPALRPAPKPDKNIRENIRAESGTLPEGERKVLTAIAQQTGGAAREQLSVLTGYKRSSRDAYISRLAAKRLVEVAGGRVLATEAGVEALGPSFEFLPTGQALRDYWLQRLPEGERRILEVLIYHHPRTVHRDELDEPTGYKRSSRDAYLHRLAARPLIEQSGRGTVRASDVLFE
jgi:hypothetical protein